MDSLVEVYVDEDKKYATLALNRVDKLNALSGEMIRQLIDSLAKLSSMARSQKIHALVLKSNSPKAFCVGADLKERVAMNDDMVSKTLLSQREIMDGLAALEIPTIALIEGAAFGGGMEMALACDIRYASPQATMGLTETRLAIIPGAGGTQRLTRLVGEARAKELIYTGRRLSADEAEHLGLVHRVAEKPSEYVGYVLDEILSAGPLALRAAKRAIEGGYGKALEKALDFERECYQRVLDSEDRIEGLKAFTEKRKPVYRGK